MHVLADSELVLYVYGHSCCQHHGRQREAQDACRARREEPPVANRRYRAEALLGELAVSRSMPSRAVVVAAVAGWAQRSEADTRLAFLRAATFAHRSCKSW